jgi:hypothetical protein
MLLEALFCSVDNQGKFKLESHISFLDNGLLPSKDEIIPSHPNAPTHQDHYVHEEHNI